MGSWAARGECSPATPNRRGDLFWGKKTLFGKSPKSIRTHSMLRVLVNSPIFETHQDLPQLFKGIPVLQGPPHTQIRSVGMRQRAAFATGRKGPSNYGPTKSWCCRSRASHVGVRVFPQMGTRICIAMFLSVFKG